MPYKPWGKTLSINLFGCDLAVISNPASIKKYIRDVIIVVNMKAYGPVHIDRFGIGKLEGYSAMQFIETSSITVHCDEPDRRTFIDIFSCKNFDSKKAAHFSKTYFGARKMKYVTLIR